MARHPGRRVGRRQPHAQQRSGRPAVRAQRPRPAAASAGRSGRGHRSFPAAAALRLLRGAVHGAHSHRHEPVRTAASRCRCPPREPTTTVATRRSTTARATPLSSTFSCSTSSHRDAATTPPPTSFPLLPPPPCRLRPVPLRVDGYRWQRDDMAYLPYNATLSSAESRGLYATLHASTGGADSTLQL